MKARTPGLDAHAAALASVRNWAEEARQARERREIEQEIAEAKKFRVPAKGRGQIEFLWNTDCEVEIVCHLDHEPADGDNWNTPYYPESVTLCAAYLRGVNIFDLLSADQIDRIEEQALIQHAEDAREAEAEYRIERYQERSMG